MMLCTARQFSIGLLALFCAALLCGCQSSSPQKDRAVSKAESAARLAESIFATEEEFYEAMRDNDPLGMVDAALAREDYVNAGALPDDGQRFAARRTWWMIESAKRYAAGDGTLLAEIEERLDERRPLTDPDSSVFGKIGKFGNFSKPNEFIRKLEIGAQSSITMRLGVAEDLGIIIYIEHLVSEAIVLTIVDSSGAVVCQEQNPRGYLICRWKAAEETELTVTVSNNGKHDTDVLLIKNQ